MLFQVNKKIYVIIWHNIEQMNDFLKWKMEKGQVFPRLMIYGQRFVRQF